MKIEDFKPLAKPFPREDSIISVCMICHRRLDEENRAVGPVLSATANQSHGICRECLPGYARDLGISEADRERILGQAHD